MLVIGYTVYTTVLFAYLLFLEKTEVLHGQQCCYDSNGDLLLGPDSGGTVDLYSNKLDWWKHTVHDVIPYILCCKNLWSNCQAYYDHRPSDDGSRYNSRPCGMYKLYC